jgi:hypothetical protein
MVPLLEPPLLLERGWDEAEDRESPGPAGGLGDGEGDGVRVGDVLLELEELPDWGLLFRSTFYMEEKTKHLNTNILFEKEPSHVCIFSIAYALYVCVCIPV